MATAVVAQIIPVEGEKKPLTPQEIEYNKTVDALVNRILNIASDVSEDMKKRQLPDTISGDKVYGPGSANRANFNTYTSQLNKTAKIVEKAKKGSSKKAKGDFIGFAVPGYINPDMARAIGLTEGSVLWPAGGKPIFSPALISSYFAHRVMALGLIHQDNLSVFTADDLMRRLFASFVGKTFDKTGAALDLNALTYPGIQQLITYFVEKRSKVKGAVGPLDPNTENGRVLTKIFKDLKKDFDQLALLKTNVKKAMVQQAAAEHDVVSASDLLQRGKISQDLFNKYAERYKVLVAAKNQLFEHYKSECTRMGITRSA